MSNPIHDERLPASQPAEKHGFFSRRRYPDEPEITENREKSPFMHDDHRQQSPERELEIHRETPAFHTPYNRASSRYTPETTQYGTEFKTVEISTHPVSTSSNTQKNSNGFADESPPYWAHKKSSFRDRHQHFFRALQLFSLFFCVGILLAVPIICTADAKDSRDGDDKGRQNKNLIYYVFLMLITIWGITGGFFALASIFPYLFRFVAHFVNPAHKRYWRVFAMMRTPVTILFAVVAGYISMDTWFWRNDQFSSWNNIGGQTEDEELISRDQYLNTVSTIDRVLTYLILWAAVYFGEKILMVYLTIHYQYRANYTDIFRSKRMIEALSDLFDYSNFVYPRGDTTFAVEDYVIYNAQDSANGKSRFVDSTAGALDRVTGNFAHAFGVAFGSESHSHWLSPRSNYAVVARALQHPASSAALAKRIWMSLVSEGSSALTVEDITDALGPERRQDAKAFFRVLDENENSDIHLDELVPTIIQAGQKRRDIYYSMGDMTHVINTVDWILQAAIGLLMLVFVLVSEVQLIKDIKEVIGFSTIGLSFVLGRTLHEFVSGAIFTIIDHPYDVGDVIEMFTNSESKKSLLRVKKISLLYTTFEEVGSNKQIHYSNLPSKIKRIVNLSRSGKNRETMTFCVDFGTTFTDLQLLQQELSTFLSARENSRDYYPELGLRVTSLCDLQRLEIKLSFLHKSNWSNEGLRATRSSRFHCAVVAAVRRVPIQKPGGGKPGLGDEGKPSYTVMITDTEAAAKRAAETEKQASKRMDYVKPEPKEDDSAKSELTEEEAAAAEQKKRKAEEKAAKDAKTKEEEHEATIRMMGIGELSDRNNAATSSIDLRDDDGHNRFAFVSGNETGVRQTR